MKNNIKLSEAFEVKLSCDPSISLLEYNQRKGNKHVEQIPSLLCLLQDFKISKEMKTN